MKIIGPDAADVARGDVADDLAVEGSDFVVSGNGRGGREPEPRHALERVQRRVVRVDGEHGLDRHAELTKRRVTGERGCVLRLCRFFTVSLGALRRGEQRMFHHVRG